MSSSSNFSHAHLPAVAAERALIIGLDGATWDLLTPLAAEGLMPNLAALMRSAALARLKSTTPFITPVAWTSFQTGSDVAGHGIYDYRYWDHHTGKLCLNHAGRIAGETLLETVAATGRRVVSLNLPMTHPPRLSEPHIVLGGLDSPSLDAILGACPTFAGQLRSAGIDYDLRSIWKRRPRSLAELRQGVNDTAKAFHGRAAAARLADSHGDWALMIVQFQNLDSLQHRVWHLLSADPGLGQPNLGSNADAWEQTTEAVAEARRAMQALDQAVGELLELASARSAAVVALSDHGFGPFAGKISVPRVLERQRLLIPASGSIRLRYQAARWRFKAQRWWWKRQHQGERSASLRLAARTRVALDWDRSPAVTLHGDLAAMVYLNRPERFGGGPIRTAAGIRQAESEIRAALRVARHPLDDTPLFTEVYSVRDRWNCEPLERCWPDVVAIPAAGWHTRSKLDGGGSVVGGDHDLTGTHRSEGVLIVASPGVQAGGHHAANLWDVAPTVLAMLGLNRPASMTGRVLPWVPCATQSAGLRSVEVAPVACPEMSPEQLAVVEQRLRDLGYMD